MIIGLFYSFGLRYLYVVPAGIFPSNAGELSCIYCPRVLRPYSVFRIPINAYINSRRFGLKYELIN